MNRAALIISKEKSYYELIENERVKDVFSGK